MVFTRHLAYANGAAKDMQVIHLLPDQHLLQLTALYDINKLTNNGEVLSSR